MTPPKPLTALAPAALRPGDVVALVCTARPAMADELAGATAFWESHGLEVRLGQSVGNRHRVYGGTEAERLADLRAQLGDPSVRAIHVCRGGYGTAQLIDALDFAALRQDPKWIIGFSDVTSLLLRLAREGVQGIHGPVAAVLGPAHAPTPDVLHALWLAAAGEALQLAADANPANRFGTAQGPLVGGCLSLLQTAVGTPDEPELNGAILVIEDVDEYHYRMHRMLLHLRRAGWLGRLAGVVVGRTLPPDNPGTPFGQSLEELVLELLPPHIPVAFDMPTGHQAPNLSWRHGGQAMLRVNASGAVLTQPAVS